MQESKNNKEGGEKTQQKPGGACLMRLKICWFIHRPTAENTSQLHDQKKTKKTTTLIYLSNVFLVRQMLTVEISVSDVRTHSSLWRCDHFPRSLFLDLRSPHTVSWWEPRPKHNSSSAWPRKAALCGSKWDFNLNLSDTLISITQLIWEYLLSALLNLSFFFFKSGSLMARFSLFPDLYWGSVQAEMIEASTVGRLWRTENVSPHWLMNHGAFSSLRLYW